MINNRKIKKQQMLMDFSYERPNDVYENMDDYTLSQAANVLCVSSQYLLWLLDSAWDEGKVLIGTGRYVILREEAEQV